MKKIIGMGILAMVIFGFLGIAQANECTNTSPFTIKDGDGTCYDSCPPGFSLRPGKGNEGYCLPVEP